MAQSGEQRREEEEVAEISGVSAWNASTTRMLISFYKENPILWDKRLKEHGNKAMSLAMYCPPIVCLSQVPRENEGTERDIEGVGWDMSIPLKLFLGLDGNGSLFPQTSV